MRVVDASFSLDAESIDGALEEVFCRVLRLDEDVEAVDSSNLVVFSLGSSLLNIKSYSVSLDSINLLDD